MEGSSLPKQKSVSLTEKRDPPSNAIKNSRKRGPKRHFLD